MKSSLLLKVKNSRYYLLLLAIISGLLLWLGWPTKPFAFLLFFSFAPLLAIEDHISANSYKRPGWTFFGYSYLAFLIWNAATTWWVYYSTSVGAIFMILANSLLMCIPLLLFRKTKQSAGASWGYFAFVLYWITFEYIHLSWDLSWPWLTLGNGFASYPQWIQWYEFTGVFGGTIWILLASLGLFFTLFKGDAIFKGIIRWRSLSFILLWILLPIIFSCVIYYTYEGQGKKVEIVILQPNIDPYTEKFVGSEQFIPFDQQVELFIALSEQQLTSDTKFLVWPETALDAQFNEKLLMQYPVINQIFRFKNKYPELSLITGLTSHTLYENKQEATPTARFREDVGYFDVFNTALFIGNSGDYTTYHKSKLVPGVEIMPYPQALGFISDFLFDLGGTSGGFGRQEERTVFVNEQGTGVAPAICYESIYGDFMTSYIRNGADLIFIITNDGWWGNSPGHKQHLQYAVLRAIETRRSIARSANTGISAFINQRGDILQPTEYGEQKVIKSTIKANEELTFYTQYGDFIARTAVWLAAFVLLAGFVKKIILK